MSVIKDIKQVISDQLGEYEEEIDNPISLLCSKMNLSTHNLNSDQALELIFSYLYWHEATYVNPTKPINVYSVLLTNASGVQCFTYPMGTYHKLRRPLCKAYPVIEYSYFETNWGYTDFVQKMFPLLSIIIDKLISDDETRKIGKIVNELDAGMKHRLWYWILTPSFPNKPEILPLLGRVSPIMKKIITQLERHDFSKELMLQLLFQSCRGK